MNSSFFIVIQECLKPLKQVQFKAFRYSIIIQNYGTTKIIEPIESKVQKSLKNTENQ